LRPNLAIISIMKVVVLYHPKSEHGGKVEDYAKEFEKLHKDRKLELISLETIEGAEMAKLYDIVQYPAVLATARDGTLLRFWQGENLPLLRELDYYFQD